MRNNYKIIIAMLFFSTTAFSQIADVGLDLTGLLLVTENFGVRQAAESTLQGETNKMKRNLEEINRNYLKLVAAKVIVEDALLNVNSALKNALAVKEIGTIITDIYSNGSALLSIAAENPHFAHIARRQVEEATFQAITLENEVKNIALKGTEKNVLMNYNYRDELVRDVFIRLKLINSGLTLARTSMEQAIKLGFLKGATPFGQWFSRDKQIAEDIIRQIQYF